MTLHTVKDVLTKKYLQLEYVEKKQSTTYIADKLGCSNRTVSEYLKKHNIKARPFGDGFRKHKKPDLKNLLNVIDADHAYLLGFITTDGNIIKACGTESLTIEINEKDGYLLEYFKIILKVDHPIIKKKGRNSSTLLIRQKGLQLKGNII